MCLACRHFFVNLAVACRNELSIGDRVWVLGTAYLHEVPFPHPSTHHTATRLLPHVHAFAAFVGGACILQSTEAYPRCENNYATNAKS